MLLDSVDMHAGGLDGGDGGLPCGEGTNLEYYRSLDYGYTSNERKKEDRAAGVMEGASV